MLRAKKNVVSVILPAFLVAAAAAASAKPILIPVNQFMRGYVRLEGHEGSATAVAFDHAKGHHYRHVVSGGKDGSIIRWSTTLRAKMKEIPGRWGKVRAIDHHPKDGCRVAASYKDNAIRIWNSCSGKLLKTLKGHRKEVWQVAFSPDGRYLVSRDDDGVVVLWDADKGRKRKVLKEVPYQNPEYNGESEEKFFSVAFSPDSRFLACGGFRTVMIFDVETGRKVRELMMPTIDQVRPLVYSPDGRIIAMCQGLFKSAIMLWDVETGEKLKTLKGHEHKISLLKFTEDGAELVSVADNDGTFFWDWAAGVVKKRISASGKALSLDQGLLAAASNGVWLYKLDDPFYAIEELRREPKKKGEFETTRAYERRAKAHWERVRRTEVPYRVGVELGSYNADRKGFPAKVHKQDLFIPMPVDKARKLDKKKIHIEGGLRYHDKKTLRLVNAVLVDDASKARYPAAGGRVSELPAAAVSYVPLPAPTVEEKAFDDIRRIPAFKKKAGKHDVAVVIGIERYDSVPPAEYAGSDASLVRDYLRAMGFRSRNIAFLADGKATFSGLKKTLERWLPNRVKGDSRVVVYYSGHGAPDPASGTAYLVPFDGDPNYLKDTGYPLERLYAKLGSLKAKQTIVLLDACFSGAGGRSVLAKGARPLVVMAKTPAVGGKMAVLTATSGAQISTSSPEIGHGLFTYFFLKAVKDGKRDLGVIYDAIKPQVEDEAKRLNVEQSPGAIPGPASLKGRFRILE